MSSDSDSNLDIEVAAMANMSDEALWKAGRSHFAHKNVRKLENLHFKEEIEPLSQEEIRLKQNLLEEYERIILVRAEAAYLLKQRGYDVTPLLNRGGKK